MMDISPYTHQQVLLFPTKEWQRGLTITEGKGGERG